MLRSILIGVDTRVERRRREAGRSLGQAVWCHARWTGDRR